jgi:hypothetical protein
MTFHNKQHELSLYQLIIDSLENTLGLIPTHKAHPKRSGRPSGVSRVYFAGRPSGVAGYPAPLAT